MSVTDSSLPEPTSTKPYMLRAIYEWCTDNGYTPYVAVFVNGQVVVPREYVKNGEIVLNISFDATQSLKIANDAITFKARFSGIARDIYVPIDNVVAVYARENGQGMAFPLSPELQKEQVQGEPPVHAKPAAAGLRLAPMGGDSTEADASAAPGNSEPTSIKSARSSRKPKLATSESITPDSVAPSSIASISSRKLSDANKAVMDASREDSGDASSDAGSPNANKPVDDRDPPPSNPPRPTLKRVK